MKARIDLIDKAIKSSDKAILKYNPVKHNHYHGHNLIEELAVIKATPKKDIVPGELKYIKFLNKIESDQTKIVTDHLDDWGTILKERYDFFERIEPELNTILNDAAPTMEKHIEGFYNAGKEVGYKQIDVAAFFGESDKNALFSLKNYNFDLIVTKSQDFRDKVREEVWKGTARGDNIEAIAKAIREKPVQPIYNPYNMRKMNPEDRSILIARTESMRGMNQGTLMSYQQGGLEQVDIPDSGTEGDFNCDCPDAVAGSPYDITDPNLPILPLHPACTHTYAPYGTINVEGLVDIDTYTNLVIGGETPVLATA